MRPSLALPLCLEILEILILLFRSFSSHKSESNTPRNSIVSFYSNAHELHTFFHIKMNILNWSIIRSVTISSDYIIWLSIRIGQRKPNDFNIVLMHCDSLKLIWSNILVILLIIYTAILWWLLPILSGKSETPKITIFHVRYSSNLQLFKRLLKHLSFQVFWPLKLMEIVRGRGPDQSSLSN